MRSIRALGLLIAVALLSVALTGCGEDTYKADPKTATGGAKGGRPERE